METTHPFTGSKVGSCPYYTGSGENWHYYREQYRSKDAMGPGASPLFSKIQQLSGLKGPRCTAPAAPMVTTPLTGSRVLSCPIARFVETTGPITGRGGESFPITRGVETSGRITGSRVWSCPLSCRQGLSLPPLPAAVVRGTQLPPSPQEQQQSRQQTVPRRTPLPHVQ